MMTKDQINKMTVSEYQAQFGKDPLEIINELDIKSEQEIENALLQYAILIKLQNCSNDLFNRFTKDTNSSISKDDFLSELEAYHSGERETVLGWLPY